MIVCNNLKKSFDDVELFNNFSYTFNDSGLYVLYGVSGSGKTTLLQMILGISDFDGGEIIYDNLKYKGKVCFEEIKNLVAYVSQDSYFIDYLTMEENLKLQSNRENQEIIDVSKKFKLNKCLKKLPNQLSLGERQRFAIIGNILQNKKIFLLDEPTSSLDKNNKRIFYEILSELKNECLIICATHDDSIFDYSSNVINFNEISKYKKCSEFILENKLEKKTNNKINFKYIFNILKSLYKQVFRFEKKFIFMYTFVFTLVLLLLFGCTNYEEKVIGSLVDNYNLKSTLILCSLDSEDYCKGLLSNYSVNEIVYHYTRNLPIDEQEEEGDNFNYDFNFDILSLPSQENNINYIENILLYGSYFDLENQVILGYEKALQLSYEKDVAIQDLIGTVIELKLPDGKDNFEIVGIFKDLSENEKTLLKANLGQYDFEFYYYLNSKYLEKYLYDDILGIDEKSELHATSIIVFFNSTKDFLKFYYDFRDKDLSNSLIRIEDPVKNFSEYYNTNELIKCYCFITSICFFVLGMTFYYQIHKTRIAYTEHNFSILNYYGYRESEIEIATTIYFFTYIFIIILLSGLLSFLGTIIINNFILTNNILPYSLFVYNLKSIILVLFAGCVISFFESIMLNFTRKKKGWFYLIKEKSDLL